MYSLFTDPERQGAKLIGKLQQSVDDLQGQRRGSTVLADSPQPALQPLQWLTRKHIHLVRADTKFIIIENSNQSLLPNSLRSIQNLFLEVFAATYHNYTDRYKYFTHHMLCYGAVTDTCSMLLQSSVAGEHPAGTWGSCSRLQP